MITLSTWLLSYRKNLLNENNDIGTDSLLHFKDYFEMLAENSKGFSYKLAYDLDGVINGVI